MEDMKKYELRSKADIIETLYEIISKKNEYIKALEKTIRELESTVTILKKKRIHDMKKALDKVCVDIDSVQETDPWTAYNPVIEAERILKNEKV